MCNAGCNRGSRVLFDITSGWSYRWVIRLLSPSAKTKHACPSSDVLTTLYLSSSHTTTAEDSSLPPVSSAWPHTSLSFSSFVIYNGHERYLICLYMPVCFYLSDCLYIQLSIYFCKSAWMNACTPTSSMPVSVCQSLSVFVSLCVCQSVCQAHRRVETKRWTVE